MNKTNYQLNPNEVHVWHADLDLPESEINLLFNSLSEDEQTRANRFHFQHDKCRFIAARGILRKLLGQYCAISPEKIAFFYNSHGKPSLIQKPELQFNLSHANTKALYAITLVPAVGIDIEYTKKDLDIDGIAKRFFAASEYQIIAQLTGQAKRQAFFTGWVRKEAFIKALGVGLSFSLEKVTVSLLPDEPAKILSVADPTIDLAQWSLYALNTGEEYQAALAVKSSQVSPQIFYI